jgi:hypothetical protein
MPTTVIMVAMTMTKARRGVSSATTGTKQLLVAVVAVVMVVPAMVRMMLAVMLAMVLVRAMVVLAMARMVVAAVVLRPQQGLASSCCSVCRGFTEWQQPQACITHWNTLGHASLSHHSTT